MIREVILTMLGTVALAGEQELPANLYLTWEFPAEDMVKFSYYIPTKKLDQWGWVGVGFKYEEDGVSMSNSDLVSINLQTDEILDRYAFLNEYPPTDDDWGGTDDLMSYEKSEVEDSTVYSWTRKMNTQDEYDNIFEKDKTYWVLWAYGDLDESGDISYHRRRGMQPFVLSEDFVGEESHTEFIDLHK